MAQYEGSQSLDGLITSDSIKWLTRTGVFRVVLNSTSTNKVWPDPSWA